MNPVIKISLAILFLFCVSARAAFAQGEQEVKPEIVFEDPAKEDVFIVKIKEAKDWKEAMAVCEDALRQCETYEDYEKLSQDVKKLIDRLKDYKYPDVLYYVYAKIRVEELSYLTKKNDIDSGRIYMSVNEKYHNDALACLDMASSETKSKDLDIDIYFLRLLIFKELFQPEKVDEVFNEMIERIAGYTEDKIKNIEKLNEISQKFSDKDLPDYAMKLKLVYASKVDLDSAKRITEDIKVSADKYFDEGRMKEALTTYDTYLKLAENYYDKDVITTRLMDIAEKYFNKARYKEAIQYYALYLFKYSDSHLADYCSYKLALSLYYDKDYANAAAKFEEFLNTYQNSIWFEKGFENLCRLYYENLSIQIAMMSLRKLVDSYPRRDTRDYAELLIGILYYNSTDYNKALGIFKKLQNDFPRSAYLYAASLLTQDINDIKKAHAPSYSFGSKDAYKVWEPYTPINADIDVGEGAQIIESKDAGGIGKIFVKTKSSSKVTFTINGLEDMDRFSEFWQDKEDQSRLPRKMRDQTEKDLLFFTWSNPDGGKFLDDKQTLTKAWKAPQEPGDYVMTIDIGDLALVRPPDSGSKKDLAKTITIHITVEK